ncbi:MAG: hypothetical protein LRY51_14065 [Geovibrio sp.]|nr:hypothetical protein [Geovibrio sp.]
MKQPVWKKWVEKERKEVKLTFTFALKHADDKELIALLKSVPRRRRGQVIRYLLLQGLKAENITKNSKINTPEATGTATAHSSFNGNGYSSRKKSIAYLATWTYRRFK